uniref:Short-chain dehydrogenase/reductase 3 n=1 Tax=Caligus rogercresseyi TaxID=217165 RepID=C1BQD3_CALRO|nr:Epidermal retinal dehydrogenase 2 [Caligus rogercresseyi]
MKGFEKGSSSFNASACMDLLRCLLLVWKGFFVALFELIFPRKMKNISGETALITGAGGGLGRELAIQMADLGVKVILMDINKEAMDETLKILQARGPAEGCLAFHCDVSNSKDVEDTLERISRVTNITILVSNAAIAHSKPFLKHTHREIESLFQVNVLSHFYLLKELLPKFIEANKGHILTIGSVAGSIGAPNLVPYSSTKFAIRGLTESLFLELREQYPKTAVKMTTAHPYAFKTSLFPKPKNKFESLIPILTSKEVARRTIEAMRRDEEVVMMPAFTSLAANTQKLLPTPVRLALFDYLDCGVHEAIE